MNYYKAMDENMMCRDFQFEVGKTYEMIEHPVLCKSGFHCCAVLDDCLNYYDCTSRFFRVEMLGTVVTKGDKSATNKIKIVSELSHDEINAESKQMAWEGKEFCNTDKYGSKFWWVDWKRNRGGGLPAIERFDGTKEWIVDGKRHRGDDKPAIEYADGSKRWYVDGKQHRDSRLPAVEYADGSKSWWVDGKLHRDGGLPAIDYTNGSKSWWVDGKLHRDNGLPAIERFDGYKEWWVDWKRTSR